MAEWFWLQHEAATSTAEFREWMALPPPPLPAVPTEEPTPHA